MSGLAAFWIGVLTAVRGPSQSDVKRKARLHCEETIRVLTSREEEMCLDLTSTAQAVKQAQKMNAMSSIKTLLMKSKNKRHQIMLISKKKAALQQHLDTLSTSELNAQVISSVKETAGVLKSMGLDKTLHSVDEIMTDLQESNQDITSIQEALSDSTTFSSSWEDNEALEAELKLLMSDDPLQFSFESSVSIPTLSNKMNEDSSKEIEMKDHIKNKEKTPESEKESDKKPEKDSRNEPKNEPEKESEKEAEKDPEKEPEKEPEK